MQTLFYIHTPVPLQPPLLDLLMWLYLSTNEQGRIIELVLV